MLTAALSTLILLAPADVGPARAMLTPDHSFELGVAAGMFMPSADHGLANDGGEVALGGTGFGLSLRMGYHPFAFVGVEAEGGHIAVGNGVGRDELYSARGHLVALYPARFAPFVVAGGGVVGLVGGEDFMGEDFTPAAHWGFGVKTVALDGVTLRADARHVIALTDNGQAHHFELSFGAAFTIAGGV